MCYNYQKGVVADEKKKAKNCINILRRSLFSDNISHSCEKRIRYPVPDKEIDGFSLRRMWQHKSDVVTFEARHRWDVKI